MTGEDDDLVATVLEADGGVDNETLSASDAQVGMQEDYGLGLVGRGRLLLLTCHVVVSWQCVRMCFGMTEGSSIASPELWSFLSSSALA